MSRERWDVVFSACLSLAAFLGLMAFGTISTLQALGLTAFLGLVSFLKQRGLTRRLRRAEEREGHVP